MGGIGVGVDPWAKEGEGEPLAPPRGDTVPRVEALTLGEVEREAREAEGGVLALGRWGEGEEEAEPPPMPCLAVALGMPGVGVEMAEGRGERE